MASELNGNHVLSKMFHRSVRYSFFGFFTVMLNTALDGSVYDSCYDDAGNSIFALLLASGWDYICSEKKSRYEESENYC